MLNIYHDPIQYFSVNLQAALQLYLEGNGGRMVGQILSLNIPPRIKFNKCICGVKNFIDQQQWGRYFARNWHRKSMEGCLDELFTGFEKIAMESSGEVTPIHINIDELLKISKGKIYGIGVDKSILEDITDFLLSHDHLYKIAVINGSIGSDDYKPGWSDIDIFIALNRTTIQSPALLKEARRFARVLRQKIYNYCILQLHGVFYSTEHHFQYHVDHLFPVECLINGKTHSDSAQFTINLPSSNAYALIYFNDHIYQSSKKLLAVLPDLDFFQKILLIHRIYAFPFAFLATQGILKYKKASFTAIADLFSDMFRGIYAYYETVNKFYQTWHINELRTIKLRRLFQSKLDMRYLNRILYPLETQIVDQIDYFYNRIMTKEMWDQFEKFLNRSQRFVLDQVA